MGLGSCLEIIESVAVIASSVIGGISLVIMARTLRSERNSATFQVARSLRDDEQEARELISGLPDDLFTILIEEMKSFEVKSGDDFTRFLSLGRYRSLRRVGFFYEYLGMLVKRKAIPFDVVFDLFSFPEGFWKSSEGFVGLARRYQPDFWENFEYLFSRYDEVEREKWGSNMFESGERNK